MVIFGTGWQILAFCHQEIKFYVPRILNVNDVVNYHCIHVNGFISGKDAFVLNVVLEDQKMQIPINGMDVFVILVIKQEMNNTNGKDVNVQSVLKNVINGNMTIDHLHLELDVQIITIMFVLNVVRKKANPLDSS